MLLLCIAAPLAPLLFTNTTVNARPGPDTPSQLALHKEGDFFPFNQNDSVVIYVEGPPGSPLADADLAALTAQAQAHFGLVTESARACSYYSG